MKKIVIIILGMAIAVPSIFAANYYVSPNGNDTNSGATWALAKKTIQAGVNVAGGGDIVLVTDGTYVLTNEISVSKGITVKSVNGASATIVDGNYPITFNRCFSVSHANAILDGFTIKNGYIPSGYLCFGGGVCNGGGTVENCTILGNTVADPGDGGGVFNGYDEYGASGIVKNCTISGNTSREGGGVKNEGMVTNCIIFGNTASDCGGGVYGGTVVNCMISNNTAHMGGGIYGGGTVQSCLISGNSATTDGGGGGVCNTHDGMVKNCVISGNTASPDGGGIYNNGTVENCTISGNTADAGHGGGVYNHNGMVRNCISYYNENGDFYGDDPQYSCVPGLSGSGNISTEPCFYDPGTGYGAYHTGGNFRLKPISPCINAGINQSWMTGAVDLDNNSRIINGIVDMGAYEYTGTPSAPTGVSATDGTFADKVRVTWGGVTDVTCFEVWRNTINDSGTASHLPNDPISATYDDTSVVVDTTYYYWVKSANAAGTSGFSIGDSGYSSTNPSIYGPLIKANGSTDDIIINSRADLSITVQIDPGQYAGINADWWVVALANGSWYYLNNAVQWIPFDGVLANCHPVNQGALFNLPATEVLNITGLGTGLYTFWFAVDSPMDGILNLDGQILLDSVNVTVQ